jgi:hypothetical protein
MPGGPFTRDDQWGKTNVDRISCRQTMACIKLNRELVSQIVSEEGQLPSLSGTRRYRLIVDDSDPTMPSLIVAEIP